MAPQYVRALGFRLGRMSVGVLTVGQTSDAGVLNETAPSHCQFPQGSRVIECLNRRRGSAVEEGEEVKKRGKARRAELLREMSFTFLKRNRMGGPGICWVFEIASWLHVSEPPCMSKNLLYLR